jgi:hypothetical protein
MVRALVALRLALQKRFEWLRDCAATGRVAVVFVARLRLVAFAVSFAVLAAAPTASAVPIGIVSFDTLIPGPAGVNAFGITNLTGPFSLPPDFPAIGSLTFLASTLTVTRESGVIDIFELGDIGSGVFEDPRFLFPDLESFISATFAATLNTQTIELSDGTTLLAASSAVLLTLLPSNGTTLAAGDIAVIDIDAAPSSQTVAEPGKLALVGVGFAVLDRFPPTEIARRESGSSKSSAL